MTKAGHCRVCDGPLSDQVDVKLRGGTEYKAISLWSRDAGYVLQEATISRHMRHAATDVRDARAISVRDNPRPGRPALDLAVLVRDKVVEGVEAGELTVTTKDGLVAQGLLDRRAEKEKDREFVMNLARLISGAGQGAPENMISDGEYVDLDADLMLAPGDVRSVD